MSKKGNGFLDGMIRSADFANIVEVSRDKNGNIDPDMASRIADSKGYSLSEKMELYDMLKQKGAYKK